ncbi:MAG TPA: hypothetical protein VIF12_05440 [Micavibrio sp.]
MNQEKPDLKTRIKNMFFWGAGAVALVGVLALNNVLENVQEEARAKSELEKIFTKNSKALPDCKNEFGRTFEVDGQNYMLSCVRKPAP